jgi:hypothetical protein
MRPPAHLRLQPAPKSHLLVLVPLAAAVVYGLTRPLVDDPTIYYFVEIQLLKILALVGCVAATVYFDRGDHMRTVWLLFTLDFVQLVIKDYVGGAVVTWPAHVLGPSATAAVRGTLMVGANAAGTAAWIVLARTWRLTGLTLGGSPVARRIVLFVAVLLALALSGWGTGRDVVALAHHQPAAALRIVSDVADVIGFALVAPIAMMAWTLRGGGLSWPYVYLTACTFCWMLFDMTDSLSGPLHLSPVAARVIEELWRCIACGLHFAAGIAQRWGSRVNR